MTSGKTIKEIIDYGAKILEKNNIDAPLLKAKIIVKNELDLTETEIILSGNENIDDKSIQNIEKDFDRLISGLPVEYITNKKGFMHLAFYVDKRVLIPRFDTEFLIETVYALYKKSDPINFIDIGSGSGCIGLTLSDYFINSKGILIDTSKDALDVSSLNAKRLNLLNRTGFLNIDILKTSSKIIMEKSGIDSFDLIISNPPYIKSDVIEKLENQVKDHEPSMALDGGDDGLIFYKEISEIAYKLLDENGYLIFEIGFDQKTDVMNILSDKYKDIVCICDYTGNDRVIVCKKNNS